MVTVCVETFDGGDVLVGSHLHRSNTAANSSTIDVDRARSTQARAAAELAAGQPELVPEVPPFIDQVIVG